MTIEAMKAIRMVYANTTKHDWPDDIWDAICKAIEAEKQEPYGYLKLSNGKFYVEVVGVPDLDCNPDYLPLHTHPQQSTWVGLTDEERKELWDEWENGHVVEATEAKLKEKNT
jgi:hypothetical protein